MSDQRRLVIILSALSTSQQQFHNSIESHTRSLTALGKDSNSYGDLLVPITLGKLPIEIKRNQARERHSEECTLSELQSALLVFCAGFLGGMTH